MEDKTRAKLNAALPGQVPLIIDIVTVGGMKTGQREMSILVIMRISGWAG